MVVSQETTESSQEVEVATGAITKAAVAVTEAAVVTEAAAVTEAAIEASTPHPAVIIKQVNEINEDGTYTVGFEAADGTFKLETRDEEGNVEGKYGYLNDIGELVIVQYSANNATGFTSDAVGVGAAPSSIAAAAPVPVTPSPEFELERKRHEAVLAHQARVVERQQQIANQRDDAQQRRNFANQRNPNPRRPVFNAAQFNQQNFNQNFNQFQQQTQQFAPEQPRRQQQFAQQPQQPAAPRPAP